jgi:transcriptional regulator with XRE-family HTH domain
VSHHLSTLGARLRANREARQLTQQALADLVSVTQSAIANIENSTSLPSVELAIKLADALGITTDALLREPVSTPEAES